MSSPESENESGEPVICAGAVVRDAGGRLLLVRRGTPPAQGSWTLPGGRVEPGENPAAAAAREVREETGLDVDVGRLLATLPVLGYLVHDFTATVVGGTLQAGDDAADVGWFGVDELARIELSPGLLQALGDMGAL
ncbi:MAG TPA: NUDIX domain-containing protein [Mycobacteriales bacterium]|nr:NUDIX domain-containing protein [Mycobacteriales bacterium]HVX69145.1 NUDIX domain-containing protein [Mycobacteriales bacterium]